MRVGLAISAMVHLGIVLVVYVVLASPRLFAPAATAPIAVDIVPADEVAAAKPEPKIDLPVERRENPAESATAEDKPAAPATDTAPATKPDPQETRAPANPSTPSRPPEQPPPDQRMAANTAPVQPPDPFAPDAVPKPLYFPMLQSQTNWGSDFEFDALADTAAALTGAEIAALRAHLEKCWKPPAALNGASKLQAVLRIALDRKGAMTAEPLLVKASASAHGPALVDTARRALSQCQPFDFLPAEKYSEWKILELSFTPHGLGG
jgi:outer membrane biosynthesis protein TonB